MDLSTIIKSTGKRTSKRVGRGIGSGKGQTAGRGKKGAKCRSGYKRRHGQEGGQRPVFRKVPIRGFTNARFKEDRFAINLGMIEEYFLEGEVVNKKSLVEKGFFPSHRKPKIKILANGELTKPLSFEVHMISEKAKEKIEGIKGTVKLIVA